MLVLFFNHVNLEFSLCGKEGGHRILWCPGKTVVHGA